MASETQPTALDETVQAMVDCLQGGGTNAEIRMADADLERWSQVVRGVLKTQPVKTKVFLDLMVVARRLGNQGADLASQQFVALAALGIKRRELLQQVEDAPELSATTRAFAKRLTEGSTSLEGAFRKMPGGQNPAQPTTAAGVGLRKPQKK